MVSTHIEDKFQDGEISQEDYELFIRSGQTHSMATHEKYYVKKRKYQEGNLIQQSFQEVFPQVPELLNIEDYYQDLNLNVSSPPPPPPSEQRQFGLARSDLGEIKKKYDWTKEEIQYLRYYIDSIEPGLGGAIKNRYAKCLTYLKESAPADILQYFHPHHLVSSDRLKNGFVRAVQYEEEVEEDGT